MRGQETGSAWACILAARMQQTGIQILPEGGCSGPGMGPASLTLRSSPPPPVSKSSQWQPAWSPARLLTLAFICLCTYTDDLTLQLYPSSLSSIHSPHFRHQTFFLLQLIPISGPLHSLFPLPR